MLKLALDCDVIVYKAGFACEKVIYSLIADGYVVKEGTKKEIKEVYTDVREGCLTGVEVRRRREVEPLKYALSNVKNIINTAREDCRVSDYVGYLSGPTNFRKEICPEYKAHRDPLHKPYWFEEIKEYLIKHHNTHYTEDGLEADDMLGILATQDTDYIICTIDKDLDQVPGKHYNFNTRQYYVVDEETADYTFWHSVLTGDAADNIKGPFGIGPKKATQLLEGIEPGEYYNKCLEVYQAHGLSQEDLDRNMKLLYILRYPYD